MRILETIIDVLRERPQINERCESRRIVEEGEGGRGAYVNNSEDLGNRSALLRKLMMDHRVPTLDTPTQAHEFSMIAHAGNLQITLPSAYINQLFQLQLKRQGVTP